MGADQDGLEQKGGEVGETNSDRRTIVDVSGRWSRVEMKKGRTNVERGLCPLPSPVSESNCQLVTIAHWRGDNATPSSPPRSLVPRVSLFFYRRSIDPLSPFLES